MEMSLIITYRELRKLGHDTASSKHQSSAYYARKWHMPYDHVRALLDVELGGRTKKAIAGGPA